MTARILMALMFAAGLGITGPLAQGVAETAAPPAGAGQVAVSPEDAIRLRQQGMKVIGGASRTLTRMSRGQDPFDANAAAEAFRAIHEVAVALPDYFPEGSVTGDTKAAPAIWENMDDFLAKVAAFEASAGEGVAASGQGEDAFRLAAQTMGATCGDCHSTYRLR